MVGKVPVSYTGGRWHIPEDFRDNGLGTIKSECRPCPLDRFDRGSAFSNHCALLHLLRLNIARETLQTPLSRPTEPGDEAGPVLSMST